MRRAVITPPPEYSAAEIKAIRANMGMSQSEFADALNVNIFTVQGWERGVRTASGGNLRLLQVAAKSPAAIRALAQPDSE